MELIFCTTCKGRTQHIAATLPRNLADNAKARFVLLDYNDSEGLAEYVHKNHMADIDSGRLIFYSLSEPGAPFRMAHAKNVAHRLGLMEGASILVNLDADNYTGVGFDDYLLGHFTQHPHSFMWSRMVKDGDGRLPRGISGRIATTAHAFLNAGGYDESQFNKWGPDDKDFNMRLRRLGFEPFEIDARFLSAIRHNDRMRYKEYPEAETDYEDVAAVAESDVMLANNGDVGTGIVFKNFDWDNPICIPAIPTRIFGIGMHKTATTSLHTALQILGYDSAHWKSAHWAKAIWEEMQTWGRSATLEKSYAVCDLPIPMMFRALDLAYPRSKFILTLRDEAGWIDSIEKHWNPEFNKFRESWSHDPFTHRCHRMLYGFKNFDPERMLERYRRHNAEVLEYFKDRPNDLLVMPMDQGAGFRELCGFLNNPVPNRKYPQAYAAY